MIRKYVVHQLANNTYQINITKTRPGFRHSDTDKLTGYHSAEAAQLDIERYKNERHILKNKI